MKYPICGERILGQDVRISNDTWKTGLNNNDLVIGPSGAGKTRSYVKPNILQCNGSMIIADTKGSLIEEVGPVLRSNGYRLLLVDFKDLSQSSGYNPLDFIRRDPKTGKCREQDVMTIAQALAPTRSVREPFWDQAAKMYLTSFIAYAMECLPENEHHLGIISELLSEIHTGGYAELMREHQKICPDSLSVRSYNLFRDAGKSSATEASITSVLGEKLNGLLLDGALQMYTAEKRLDFRDLAKQKTALFLTISDVDRSMDRLVSLFYMQALQVLVDYADTCCRGHRLPIPVRMYLDDFATNAFIQDFPNIISVIRSREISVSVILQSISQLEELYGRAKATTILNNCDNLLYLGGQDVETARMLSPKMNKPVSTILNMGLDEAYLFTRGREVRKVRKFDLRTHPHYAELAEEQEVSCGL